jgi:AcrR family transcriptional regulator
MPVSRSERSRGARRARPRQSVNGAARDRVGEIQRARILAGMAEAACERGVESTTVAHVVGRAGVSRRTFYDLFDDVRDCFRAAFDDAVGKASGRVLPAYERQGRWVDGVRAGLFELLGFFDEEPQLARLCVVQALAGGPQTLARRTEILRALTAVLDESAMAARGRRVAPLTGEGVVGAVLAVIHARLLEAEPAPLTGLLGALMGMIVLPYLGPAAAQRELSRPAPRALERAATPPESAVALEHLGMRLTYRTLRALAVIAGHPAISNRELAVHAGITDQGQTSKLLARLERLGLIHNSGEGHTKGATNAWTLTAKGASIQATLRIDAE